MLLQKLGKIENSKFYLDLSIRNASEQCSRLRQKLLVKDKFLKRQKVEAYKIQLVERYLGNNLKAVIENFPKFEQLPTFYHELAKVTIDVEKTKGALKNIDLLKRNLRVLSSSYSDRIMTCTEIRYLEQSRKAFYARIFASARKVDKDLAVLEESRKIIREYPVIKTDLPTVAIAGFPNVGKTTLLYKLTGSKPEIREYAFTTKTLNTAYLTIDGNRIQLIDTPGTLNRFEKMNNIERQAYIAIRHLAQLVIYIFDITEPYSLEQQKELYKNLLKFEKPILVWASKTDLTKQKFGEISSFNPITDLDMLKKEMHRILL
jgi:nucleolar GTP-binding protein